MMTENGMNLDIGIREVPARFLACVHHTGPFVGNSMLFEGLFARVLGWAGARSLIHPVMERIAVFHNDPELTPPEELRMSVGITVPPDVLPEDSVDILEIPAGAYAVASGVVRFDQHNAAWWELMGEWLPCSGWCLRNESNFEVIRNVSSTLLGSHHIELWVPVQTR